MQNTLSGPMEKRPFFATAPKGMEPLLADELRELGASDVKESRSGAFFAGGLEAAYTACLWSRLANRILLPLAIFHAETPEDLYREVQKVDWQEHLASEGSLAVDCHLSSSKMTHSHYAALKIKDAVVDQMRERTGARPSVDLERPDVRLNAHIYRNEVRLSLDLAGDSLHRRGYRQDGASAPLKENLAAAILIRAGWPQVARQGGALLDPMCGSGTLLLEGALIAADIAPGLERDYFGFQGWARHDAELWERLVEQARRRRESGLSQMPPLVGYDANPAAVKAAWSNAQAIGMEGRIHFEKRSLEVLGEEGLPKGSGGLLVVNPPYGERLGEIGALKSLYACLGTQLKKYFQGWKAAVFTGNPELGSHVGLRAHRRHVFFNGPIKCQLLHFVIDAERFPFSDPSKPVEADKPVVLSSGAQMFANRLKKNMRTMGKWARQNRINCYRLYDADMPEYAVAIDIYDQWVHVQEYQAPKSVDAKAAGKRLKEVMAVLPVTLGLPADLIFLKVRRQQKGLSQYNKMGSEKVFHEVSEGNCRFLVNFSDYLDTGLFLDHRPIRATLQQMAEGKRFLNLFAYTGAATVHAAKGGAASTTTVDMSKTYLEWAQRNLSLNGFSGREHRLIQADCLAWLEEEKGQYDLIFLDPPTFSNSSSMDGTFDVQRDHVPLLRSAAKLLSPDGVMVFSNNFRRFQMDTAELPELVIEDITAGSIPRDFSRNQRIHNCWKIRLDS